METKNTLLLNIKREFIENRKAILLSIGTLWGAFLLIGGVMGYYGTGGGMGEITLFCVLLAFSSYVFTSIMFSDMKRKETRIATLMVPASMFEKFITRWLACVPALFIILIISFYIGDASRIIVDSIVGNTNTGLHYSRFVNPWGMMSANPYRYSQTFTILSSYFFYQSIYLLGAILMPKLSFIKTTAALWVFQTIFGIIMLSLSQYLVYAAPIQNSDYIWSGTIFFVLTLGIYWLVYYRFKRSQIIYSLFR